MKRYPTLQENYRARRLTEAQERRVLAEIVVFADLLLEQAGEDLDIAIESLEEKFTKLIAESEFSISEVNTALSNAVDRLNAVKGKDEKQKKKLLVHATAFSDLLKRGFARVPEIYKKHTGNEFPQSEEIKSLNDLAGDKKDAMFEDLKKAFSPGGQSSGKGIIASIISMFSKLGKEPAFATADDLAKGVMGSSITKTRRYMQMLAAAPSPPPDETATIQAAAEDIGVPVKPEAQPVASGQVITTPQQLVVTLAAGQAAKKSGGDKKAIDAAVETAADKPDASSKEFIDFVTKESKQERTAVERIISALLTAKLIRSNVSVKNESLFRHTRQKLLFGDVVHARYKLREAAGSATRWIDLLLEQPTMVGISPGQQSSSSRKTVNAGPLIQAGDTQSGEFKKVSAELKKLANDILKLDKDKDKDKVIKLLDKSREIIDAIDHFFLKGEIAEAGDEKKDQALPGLYRTSTNIKNFNNELQAKSLIEDTDLASASKFIIDISDFIDKMVKFLEQNPEQQSEEFIKNLQDTNAELQKMMTSSSQNSSSKAIEPKFQNIINKIKDSIADISADAIAAVLAVIPKFFLLGENRRRQILT